jgi:hypothetical protein
MNSLAPPVGVKGTSERLFAGKNRKYKGYAAPKRSASGAGEMLEVKAQSFCVLLRDRYHRREVLN